MAIDNNLSIDIEIGDQSMAKKLVFFNAIDCYRLSFIFVKLSSVIDRLQPRDKAAMLVVKTIKNFFAEFAW